MDATASPKSARDERQERLGAALFDKASVRACAALTLLLLSSYLLNTALFPLVAQTFPLARELSTYSGALFSVALAIVAYRKPSAMSEGLWSGAGLVFVALSAITLYAGIVEKAPWILAAGSPFGGVGSVWFTVLMGVALAHVGPKKAAFVIPAAFMLNYGAQTALVSVGIQPTLEVAVAAYFALLAGSYLLIRPSVRSIMASIRDTTAPTVLNVTSPSSYLPFSSLVFVSIFLFNVACGYSANQDVHLSGLAALASFVPAAVVFGVICVKGRFSADGLYRVSALLVFAGFLTSLLPLLGAGDPISQQAHVTLLHAGADCFSILMYYVIAAVGWRNTLGAVSAAAFAFAAQWIGIGIGAPIAHGVGLLAQDGMELPVWATIVIAFIFMAYNYVGLRDFSFTRTVEGILPAHKDNGEDAFAEDAESRANGASRSDASANAEEGGRPEEAANAVGGNGTQGQEGMRFDDACEAVAKRFGLTNRETDVLKLLGRGRTSPVIQEKLVLSHNTVKTHVRHIYAKMDVHSQQEVINLIESKRGR